MFTDVGDTPCACGDSSRVPCSPSRQNKIDLEFRAPSTVVPTIPLHHLKMHVVLRTPELRDIILSHLESHDWTVIARTCNELSDSALSRIWKHCETAYFSTSCRQSVQRRWN